MPLLAISRNGAFAMIGSLIVVKAAYDPEARVWFVEDSDLHGLNSEASSLEELVERLPVIVADLLEANGFDASIAQEFPIELIAHARTRVRLGTPA
jgi:hypothetical protein